MNSSIRLVRQMSLTVPVSKLVSVSLPVIAIPSSYHITSVASKKKVFPTYSSFRAFSSQPPSQKSSKAIQSILSPLHVTTRRQARKRRDREVADDQVIVSLAVCIWEIYCTVNPVFFLNYFSYEMIMVWMLPLLMVRLSFQSDLEYSFWILCFRRVFLSLHSQPVKKSTWKHSSHACWRKDCMRFAHCQEVCPLLGFHCFTLVGLIDPYSDTCPVQNKKSYFVVQLEFCFQMWRMRYTYEPITEWKMNLER